MPVVHIDPKRATEYAIKLREGATPTSPADSQTWYPERQLLVGYSTHWGVDVAVDGGVDWVAAADATVTIEQSGDNERDDKSTDTSLPVDSVDWTFDRTVNAVEDLGMDPTGSKPADEKLTFDDGTLIEFPPGTYRFEDRHDGYDVTNWGVRGLGDSREDVEFVGPEKDAHRIFNVRSGRNILVENLTFNQRDTEAGSLGNVFKVQDNLQMRTLKHKGFEPDQNTGATSNLNVLVENPDGVAFIEDYDLRMGFEEADYPGNAIGMWAGPTHTGTLYLRNIKMENTPGLYMSRTEGDVRIENSYFKNNDSSSIRACGEDSYIKDTTIEIDVDNSWNVVGEHDFNYGVRWESGFLGKSGGYMENVEIICKSVNKPVPLVKVDGSAGGMEMRNCRLVADPDGVEPIVVNAPGASGSIDGTPDKPWDVTLNGVDVSGSAAGDRAVIQLDGRDGSTVVNCHIEIAADRPGIAVRNAQNCAIRNSEIRVGGTPLVTESATVDTSDLVTGAVGGTDTLPRKLTVTGTGSGVVSYSLAVSETLESGGSLNSEDSIDGTTAEGAVANGSDSYRFAGTVTNFSADGEVQVTIDGEDVDPASL